MKRISIFLIILALIAGLVGCGSSGDDSGKLYTLTSDHTAGGTVTTDNVTIPRKTILSCNAGTVVSLNAILDSGYQFVR